MRLKVFFIAITTLLCFISISTVTGQEQNQSISRKDTIREVIVYEYDTVYVAPDTLKLTDTVVEYQIKQKSVSPKKSFRLLDNLNILKSFSENWSLGIGVNTVITGVSQNSNIVDSFSRKKTINSTYEIHINYEVNRFKYSLGIGFTPYHEQLQYQETTFMSSPVSSNGSYDSLKIKRNYITDNYYRYLTLFFNFGKKWGKGKVFFILNSYLSSNILINFTALSPVNPPVKINSSSVQKITYQLGINPCIGYKTIRKMEVSLGPFCNYSVFNNKKYPSKDQVIIGITCRIQ